MDEQLSDLATQFAPVVDAFRETGLPCLLRRLVLPAKFSDALLGYLANEGVTALNVFPGFEGIADSMREEFRLGDLDPEF